MRLGISAAVLGLLALVPAARADETVKIAYIDPLSGPLAETGPVGRAAFPLRNRPGRMPRRPPAQGRKFELVAMDNEVSPEKSLTLLRKAVDDGIHYITQGNGSAVAFALVDAIQKNNKRDPSKSVVFLNYAAVDPGA